MDHILNLFDTKSFHFFIYQKAAPGEISKYTSLYLYHAKTKQSFNNWIVP